jgi:hypothetical protein
VVSDQQRPATEGVAYVLQGEWDLAGRRCAPAAVSAGAATPASCGLSADGRLLLAEIALK